MAGPTAKPGLAVLLAVTLLASCSSGALPTPLGGDAWPPYPILGQPQGVTLTLQGRHATLQNGSDRTFWLDPPVLQTWHHPCDCPPYWVEFAPVAEGTMQVAPGTHVDVDVAPSTDPVRVGAALYDMGSPTQADNPWFVWVDVPPGG